MPADSKKRRWSQIGLRSLLIPVTICAIFLAWKSRADRQRELIDRITRYGGRVGYDYQVDPISGEFKIGTDDEPSWILRLVGPDYWRRVCRVELNHQFDEFAAMKFPPSRTIEESDDSWQALIQLNDVKHLDLRFTRITDISSLEKIDSLETLNITDLQVTDISSLKKHQELRELSISECPIKDFQAFKHLTSLRKLTMRWLDIRDLDFLAHCTKLQRLDAPSKSLTDISGINTLVDQSDRGLRRSVARSARFIRALNSSCRFVVEWSPSRSR